MINNRLIYALLFAILIPFLIICNQVDGNIIGVKSIDYPHSDYLERKSEYIENNKKENDMLTFAQFLNESMGYNNQGYAIESIKEIQKKLVDLGFLNSVLYSGRNSIDGKFGQATTDALSKFQIANGLPNSNGIINSETMNKMGVSLQFIKPEDLNNPKATSEPIENYGNFTPSTKEISPLIVVYGGIDVGGRKSGDYMYDYFKQTGNSYNLFVAKDHTIDGYGAYTTLLNYLQNQRIYPNKKALYLFSGGQRPGITLLKRVSPEEFEKIYLVDIYIGQNSETERLYTELSKKYPNKVEYYYTGSERDAGGSVNLRAKNTIISNVSVSKRGSNHMLTNNDAVYSLINYFR